MDHDFTGQSLPQPQPHPRPVCTVLYASLRCFSIDDGTATIIDAKNAGVSIQINAISIVSISPNVSARAL